MESSHTAEKMMEVHRLLAGHKSVQTDYQRRQQLGQKFKVSKPFKATDPIHFRNHLSNFTFRNADPEFPRHMRNDLRNHRLD